MEYSNLHQVQMNILNLLMFYREASFGQLRPKGFPTDHFNYHLQSLVKCGILEVKQRNKKRLYSPTLKGKKLISRIETENNKVVQQGKRAVVIYGWRNRSGTKTKEYLVYRREKEPFFGFVGFHTGKIREGETVRHAAKREFLEETGLTANLKLRQIRHYLDYDDKKEFIRDIYFYCFEARKPKGKLIKKPEGEGVANFWATRKELENGNYEFYPGFWDDLWLWDNDAEFFLEKIRTINGY